MVTLGKNSSVHSFIENLAGLCSYIQYSHDHCKKWNRSVYTNKQDKYIFLNSSLDLQKQEDVSYKMKVKMYRTLI